MHKLGNAKPPLKSSLCFHGNYKNTAWPSSSILHFVSIPSDSATALRENVGCWHGISAFPRSGRKIQSSPEKEKSESHIRTKTENKENRRQLKRAASRYVAE